MRAPVERVTRTRVRIVAELPGLGGLGGWDAALLYVVGIWSVLAWLLVGP